MTHPLGQLDIKVIAPAIEAGTPTTIDLIIRNPFDQPISILAIRGPGSSAIRQTSLTTNRTFSQIGSDIGKSDGANYSPIPFTRKVLNYLSRFSLSEVRLGGITAQFPGKQRSEIRITAASGSQVEWKRPIPEGTEFRIDAAKESKVVIQLADEEVDLGIESQPKPIQLVAVGAEVLASFELVTTRWLLFKPLEITLYAQVEYQVNNVITTQVVPVPISIKAPLRSILIGSNLGAIFGFLARQIKEGGLRPAEFHRVDFFIGALGALVMATIATVAFARKQSAQGFITIEDFYGGFLVGALIGYFGTQYFERIIGGEGAKQSQSAGSLN
jgi:hypothetical protein